MNEVGRSSSIFGRHLVGGTPTGVRLVKINWVVKLRIHVSESLWDILQEGLNLNFTPVNESHI